MFENLCFDFLNGPRAIRTRSAKTQSRARRPQLERCENRALMAAGAIISPVSAVVDVGGPGFGSINNTINQRGLFVRFTSGVTNFDGYIDVNPRHSYEFPTYEWFSNEGTTGATVTYDLGSTVGIDKLALWNEESAGIGRLDLYVSTDGTTFRTLATGLIPTDHPLVNTTSNYSADVFSFPLTKARFVRFVTSDSPQPDPATIVAVGIGEVAFRVAPDITITSLSTRTFITTDEIELKATVTGAPIGTQVLWTVQGLDAAASVTGFDTNFVTTTDGSGIATYRFTPSNNPNLVNDRRTNWTKGNRMANQEISFQVIAKMTISGNDIETRLSDTTFGPLTQDETDRLRQEYYDYNIPVPARGDVVPFLGPGFNQGNYGVQLSVGLNTRYNAIVAAYRGRPVSVVINGLTYNTTIPANAPVTISSGYRNPQRNRAVGSRIPDSSHTRGRALDLVPSVVHVVVMVNGARVRVPLSLHGVLYPALQAAAATQGTAIAEQGAIQVPVGDPREDHIHVQW